MTILWAGTSTADFAIVPTATVVTTGAQIADNVAEGVQAVFNGMLYSPNFAPADDIWFSSVAYSSGVTGEQFLYIIAGENYSPRFAITGFTGNVPRLQVRRSGSWVTLATASLSFTQGTKFRIDARIKAHASEGIFEVFINGVSYVKYEGNTMPSDGSNMEAIGAGSTTTTPWVHSAVIVADEDTRKFTFVQRLPNGNGAETDWTGGFGNIDETGFSDADFITTTNAGDVSTFTFAAIPSGLETKNVAALVINGRTRNAGDITEVKGVARIGGTNYEVSGEHDTSAIFSPQTWVFNTNPANGQAWLGSDINSAQFGVKAA